QIRALRVVSGIVALGIVTLLIIATVVVAAGVVAAGVMAPVVALIVVAAIIIPLGIVPFGVVALGVAPGIVPLRVLAVLLGLFLGLVLILRSVAAAGGVDPLGVFVLALIGALAGMFGVVLGGAR